MEKVGAYTDRATDGGEWRPGNPGAGQQATPMLAAYFNMLQRELTALVEEGGGLALDKDDNKQLLKTIRRMRGGAATNFGQWLWSDSHEGSPGAGRVALNNATPSLATELLIAEVSSEAVDFTQSLGLLRSGDTVTFHERDTVELSHRFRVTGPAAVHGSYRAIPVAYVSGDGAIPDEDKVVSVLLTQAGASDASLPLFIPQWCANRAAIPAGYAPADGQALPRATFPEAWAGIEAGNVPTVADAVWLSTPTERGKYSPGDGATTFRLPDYNGKSVGSLGAPFFRGDGALSAGVAGVIQLSAFESHSHLSPSVDAPISAGSGQPEGLTKLNDVYATATDPLCVTSLTGDVETRPLNVTGCWVIKLFGAVVNPGSADAAQLATDYAVLVTRVVELENRPRSLGDGQSWQNLAASRALNTTYTNTSDRSILVYVQVITSTPGGGSSGLVGGEVVSYYGNNGSGGVTATHILFVKPSQTYRVNGSSLTAWREVRS